MVWGLPRCVWARESTAPAQGNQSLSRELRASALCPGLEARFPARRREERGCGPVTGKDRASCQRGGAPALRPGAWTVACQAPLSMIFFRQQYWRGLPFPCPGDFPDPGIEPVSPVSPASPGGVFTIEPSGKPSQTCSIV